MIAYSLRRAPTAKRARDRPPPTALSPVRLDLQSQQRVVVVGPRLDARRRPSRRFPPYDLRPIRRPRFFHESDVPVSDNVVGVPGRSAAQRLGERAPSGPIVFDEIVDDRVCDERVLDDS